ncbi:MAG: hypothetical protein Q7T68_07660 [Sphingopyxis sp.]|nr:hypothetical protein [Sphingopyxis sp.]
MRGWGWSIAAVLLINAPPALAREPISLPIATGLWINSPEKCATVRNGYIFDGARWGAVYYYGPNGSLGPVADVETIGRTTPRRDGFTEMQLGEAGGVGYFRVRSLGPNRMILRTGAPGPDGIQVMDDTLTRCAFSTLPPKMRAAIKKFSPALAR